jgi:hypothetical protein
MFICALPLAALLLLPASSFAQNESDQNFTPAQHV